MPSEDLRTDSDAVLVAHESVIASDRISATFAQALPETLRRLFPAAAPRDPLPPELAFLVAEGVTSDLIEPFARDAAAAGVTGEAALFADGLCDDLYYRMLARHLGALYLEGPLPLSRDTDIEAAASAGVAPLAPNRYGLGHVQAPRGRHLRELLRPRPAKQDDVGSPTPSCLLSEEKEAELRGTTHATLLKDRRVHSLAITTPRRLDALLRRHGGRRSLQQAENGLADWDASLSARGGLAPWQIRAGLILAVVTGFGLGANPGRTAIVASLTLMPLFMAAVVQHLLVVRAGRPPRPTAPDRAADRDLPIYTLLVPLFHETRVLQGLVCALDALDYPPTKLDIKLLLEASDRDTVAAVARLNLPARYDVMVLGEGHPQTKPRALNAGLAWARGAFVVVYDAEDRPEPGQLRAAARRFAGAPAKLACLQARLVIDHADESWITRLFALEYAALFGVVKPGLAALGLPVPLGGTSNHFRIASLLKVGGWDAWNVTEDIDLGFRLARFGFAVEALDSWTAEEAPTSLVRWLRQRARWLKGWMVTLAVCTRDPARLVRDLGGRRALSVAVSLGATVTSALVGPPLMGLAIVELARGMPFGTAQPLLIACAAAWIGLLGVGAVALLWPAVVGLRRIGRRDLAPWLLALPVYLLLITLAAWRAFYDVCRDPQRWNKTEHGLARCRAGAHPPMRLQQDGVGSPTPSCSPCEKKGSGVAWNDPRNSAEAGGRALRHDTNRHCT